jgi:hypothetical protein
MEKLLRMKFNNTLFPADVKQILGSVGVIEGTAGWAPIDNQMILQNIFIVGWTRPTA